MDDELRNEILRRRQDGARALSGAEMAQRQREAALGMRPRGPLTSDEQDAMRNVWPRPGEGLDTPQPGQPRGFWPNLVDGLGLGALWRWLRRQVDRQ